ncbi:hypothetical protein NA57DRAFT_75741 [Rhizodiscina lignyota]|uniref:VOC domain-containing protein n=1 Tax=Rhizodiscina lignyota TaxID=1504668 RepID=A0A9P4MA76_9PEZI|nr:hypothetical protein NA57DRAFT_75741 [Rhizodiscina lignyota]
MATDKPWIGTPCWIEIPAVDLERCKDFYLELFEAWDLKSTPAPKDSDAPTMAMYQFKSYKTPFLSGGIMKIDSSCKGEQQKNGNGMTVYYLVDNLEKTEERIIQLGGKKYMGRTPTGKEGAFAKCHDTEGNLFGIYEVSNQQQAIDALGS